MRVILPTLDLKIFGFREEDVINLQKVLKSDNLKNYFETVVKTENMTTIVSKNALIFRVFLLKLSGKINFS